MNQEQVDQIFEAAKETKAMTFDEVVQDLMNTMNEHDRHTWLAVSESDLILGHLTTGIAIRNYYGFWHGSAAVKPNQHPDDASMEVIKAVWKNVHAQNAKSLEIKALPENDSLFASLKV